MTAKEAIKDAIDGMTEEEAEDLLSSLRRPKRPFPSPVEMLRMSDSELDTIFAKYPPETDMEDLELWELGTSSDLNEMLDADDEPA